jgi:hypothetical protein
MINGQRSITNNQIIPDKQTPKTKIVWILVIGIYLELGIW